MFFAEIWRERYPTITLRKHVGKFLFLASLKSYDYFSEENARFINSQSLTTCQKQTKQVRERCQEDIAMLIASSRSTLTGNELDS